MSGLLSVQHGEMAKAVFNRQFDATDTTKGVSIRVRPSGDSQTLPRWVIAQAVEAGAAVRHSTIKAPATAAQSEEN